MPEILTESFCERCGTRYTFQSSAPKVGRVAKFKVLSRGLKNYVLSDETSLDEALADARSVDDREQSVEQLDAFHKTFNFCMSCRQYTCANCWNEREGRCLSCAPSLSVGLLPSGMPALNPIAGMASLTNGHSADGNGHAPLQADGSAWPEADLGIASDDASLSGTEEVEEKPVSRLEALFGREEAARIKASAPVYDDAEPTSVPEMIGLEEARSKDRKVTPKPEPIVMPEQVSALSGEDAASDEPAAPPVASMIGAEVETEAQDVASESSVDEDFDFVAAIADVAAEDEPDARIATAATVGDEPAKVGDAAEPAVAGQAEPVPLHPVDPATDELAAAAAAQTHGLLDKFRARPVVMPEPKPIPSTPAVPRVAMEPPAAPMPLVAAAPNTVEPAFQPTAPTPPPSVPGPTHLPYAAAGPMAVPAAPQPYGVIGRPATNATPTYPAQPAMPYAAQTPPPYDPTAPQPYLAQIGQPYTPSAAQVQPYPAPPQPQGGPTPGSYPPFQPGYTSPPLQPQYGAPPASPQYAPPPAPSWRMVAPESPYVAPASGNGHVYNAPPPPPANEPQWPDAPSWPTPVPAASRTRGAEAVWAESTRDLLSRPETGVSACFKCGLPLSATARFCRRCGTSQVSA
jgi:hypothetical protein